MKRLLIVGALLVATPAGADEEREAVAAVEARNEYLDRVLEPRRKPIGFWELIGGFRRG
jgi:hypothetical protein